jgi:hypothetical protein
VKDFLSYFNTSYFSCRFVGNLERYFCYRVNKILINADVHNKYKQKLSPNKWSPLSKTHIPIQNSFCDWKTQIIKYFQYFYSVINPFLKTVTNKSRSTNIYVHNVLCNAFKDNRKNCLTSVLRKLWIILLILN